MNILWKLVFISLAVANLSSAYANCGNYDPSTALEYRNLYQEALKARDYERLKQLREQRANTDLWVRSGGSCESGSTTNNGEGTHNSDTIAVSAIAATDVDFNCPWYNLSCKVKQKICKDWVEHNNTETGYEWLGQLPPCPCTNLERDVITLRDWAFSPGGATETQQFHPGATGGCYRSPAIDAGNEHPSAQQCCYDSNSALITAGAGAGTPDIDAADGVQVSLPDIPWIDIIESDSVVITEQAEGGHFFDDVLPFSACGWEIYTEVRKPDNANSCPTNVI